MLLAAEGFEVEEGFVEAVTEASSEAVVVESEEEEGGGAAAFRSWESVAVKAR